MKEKKAAGLILSLALIAGTLSGCGKAPEEEGPPEAERGRYVQREAELPQEWETLTIKQIFTVEDSVHILTVEQNGEFMSLREWEQQEEGFVDVTEGWLAGMELQGETWVDMQLMQSGETQYLYVQLIGDEGLQGHLWRGDAGGAVEITPGEWSTLDETWGIYLYVQGVAMLEDGMLGALSYTSLDIISGEDGHIQKSFDVTGGYRENVLSDGKNLYLFTMSDSGGVSGIEKRPGGSEEDAVQIPLPLSSMSGLSACALEDGTLIIAAAEGIYRYIDVSESWEEVISGSETDFALTTCWCIGLTALNDGRVYALFNQEGGGTRLLWYEYDPDAVTEVTERLTLYTVIENPMLKQAAVLYHREHPEVLITVEYVYEQYSRETPDYEQVYQTLNTRLMGEEAPDILVMDHLKVESYSEKGLLADISDIVDPLEASGEVMSNITGAYVQEDGKRYVVPLQFGFPIAVGRDVTAADMASLERLAAFLEGKQESYFGSLTVSELVDMFYPYFCGEIVADGELDRETLGRVLGQLKAVADNSGILEARDDDERRYNVWDLASQAKAAVVDVNGFWDCMLPMAMMEYIRGDFSGFESCFVPHMLAGVNARSEYQDTAKDFIRFALSEKAQNTEFYNGFPVNQAAFMSLAAKDRSDVAAETMVVTEGGGMEPFEIGDFSQEIAQKLVEISRNLDRPAVEDNKIREELIGALPGYLDGSRTLEETLDAIEGGLRMYLAE